MTINGTIEIPGDNSARQTWIAWGELLARPDASPFVANLDQASDDLIRIFDSGFPSEQMEEWLREWPTPVGRQVFDNRREP